MSGTRTSDRGHLSIGEVLNLLQDDFPDITISKIRFLESQGLLDPERTPSGYRKFYESDITRLRWILTQQREHFLPLKVIKDRLDDGSYADDDPETESPDPSLPADHGPVPADDLAGDLIADGAGPDDGVRFRVDDDITLHGVPSPVGSRAAAVWGTPSEHDGNRTADHPGHAPDGRPGADTAGPPDDPDPAVELATVSSLRPAPDPAIDEEPTMPEATPPVPSASTPDLFDTGATTMSLNVEELCRATGLTARQIGELERFGLIESDQLGATARYDEEALVVARVAAQMMEQGVEVRHLRMFKLAAEREAAFYEQLVLPILKQRDPKARQEALDSLRVLAAGGDALRTAMLRSALRHLVRHP